MRLAQVRDDEAMVPEGAGVVLQRVEPGGDLRGRFQPVDQEALVDAATGEVLRRRHAVGRAALGAERVEARMQREDHQPPAAPEHPAELADRLRRVVQVAEQVVADHQVDGGVVDRQRVDGRTGEGEGATPFGGQAFGRVDQALAGVDADDVRAAGREDAGEVALAAAGVEDPQALARSDRVEYGPVGELGTVPVTALSDDLDPEVGVRLPPLACEVGDVLRGLGHLTPLSWAWRTPCP